MSAGPHVLKLWVHGLVREVRGVSLAECFPRDGAVKDLGLFLRPAAHRKAAALVLRKRGLYDALSEATPPKTANAVHDYAQPTEIGPDEYVFGFSELGQAIHDLIFETAERYNDPSKWTMFVAEMEPLAITHPNNPWAHAAVLQGHIPASWDHEWFANVKVGSVHGAPLTSKSARDLLPRAKKAIGLFVEIAGDKLEHLATPKLLTIAGETRAFAVALEVGSLLAANAGERDLAAKWLQMRSRMGDANGMTIFLDTYLSPKVAVA